MSGITPSKPRVHLFTGGGTLPRNPADRLEYARYMWTGEPRLTGSQLLERLPELDRFARVTNETDDFVARETLEDLARLALVMEQRLDDPDVAGVVFILGTNTLEEAAYFLNLTVRREKPVVIVGAQRPFGTMSSDGPLNLLNAIRVAGAEAARGKGAMVVTNDEINAARDVTKTSTYRLQTFQSRDSGQLGCVDVDGVHFYRAPTRTHTARSRFDVQGVGKFPKVAIIASYLGDDGDLARAAANAGAKGIVVAGTGAGCTENARAALKELHEKEGVVVVRSSRVGSGRVVRDDNYQEPGFVAADNLLPQKARILLQLALTQTSDPEEIQAIFNEY